MKWDFTMTQHIFLTGKKHIGKSTLIQKILDDYKKTAALFRKKILNLLDGQTPILGVLQEPAESFWPEIVNHPKVEIIIISEDNRNDCSLLNHIQYKISSPNDYSRGYAIGTNQRVK